MSGAPRWSVGHMIEEQTLPPVDRMRLIKYAGASGDFNPIHLVDEAAADAGLKGIIAHGMLTVATMGLLFSPYLEHGYVKTFRSRFSGMVFLGDVLRVGGRVSSVEEMDEGRLYNFEVYARRDEDTVASGEVGFLVFEEQPQGGTMTEEKVGSLDKDQLTRLAQYFDEKVTFSRHIKSKVDDVEPGKAVCHIDVEDVHLNGNGTLHGGVYASLIDNAMGLAVAALVGLRTATIGIDVRFLGAVREGRIICSAEVVHRTRRIATLDARVRDGEGNLVALGTGTFRIFEKRGDPIV